jgi:hypothetical protein
MKVLGLFSGVGGFELGLQRAGFDISAMCEIEEPATRVLKKNFPNTVIFDNVKTLHLEGGEYDVMCGGFPCQDISVGGKGAGITGERSGLWKEYLRNQNMRSLKTSLQSLAEELKSSYTTLPKSGTMRLGQSTTPSFLEFPNEDVEFTLWQSVTESHLEPKSSSLENVILTNTDEKWSLSHKALSGVLRRSQKEGKKDLPTSLVKAMQNLPNQD